MMIFSFVILLPMTVESGMLQGDDQQLMLRKQFMFPVMENYMPHGKHLKFKRLLRKLGDDFDSEWMSVRQPDVLNYVPESKIEHLDGVDHWLNRNKIDYVISTRGDDFKYSNQTKETIVSFLEKFSRCDIQFQWEDMGGLFWPRYIKSGTCATGSSCSWPSGMHCQPKEAKTLRILNWRCFRRKSRVDERPKNKRTQSMRQKNGAKILKGIKRVSKRQERSIADALKQKLKCRWKKIIYEVTSECACSC